VTPALRVLIADDHPPTRAGVRMALERDGWEVCAEVANAGDAVSAALRERPDLCLIDIGMPGNGLRAVSGISRRLPNTPIVMLTISRSSDDLFDALRAGASGYLLKDMDPVMLPPALRAAVAGEAALPGALTARLIEEFRHRGVGGRTINVAGRSVELTPRERDVLELLTKGLSTAQMASRLFLSEVTIRRHMSGLMHKLEVSSRDELRRLVDEPSNGERQHNGD
jgi:two-component system, NarL family, nitrate/nitrite response regulator NarL